MLVARTLRWQFFTTPDETLEALQSCTAVSNMLILEQLHRPGVVARPVTELNVFRKRTPEMHRLLLTGQSAPPGQERGTLDASNILGLVEVAMPFVADGSLFLGSIATKIEDADSSDVAAARALIRHVKAFTSARMVVRLLATGSSQTATGLGFSIAAKELVEGHSLRWKQLGVDGIDFHPISV